MLEEVIGLVTACARLQDIYAFCLKLDVNLINDNNYII